MAFLERVFGVNPDNGSGVTEVAVFLLLMVLPLIVAALLNSSEALEPRSPAISEQNNAEI